MMITELAHRYSPELVKNIWAKLLPSISTSKLQKELEKLDKIIKILKEENGYLYVSLRKFGTIFCAPGYSKNNKFSKINFGRLKNIKQHHLENYGCLFGTLIWHYVRRVYPLKRIVHGQLGSVIDCGAHIGVFTVIAGKELYKRKIDEKVVAIEIDQGNFKTLRKNIGLNNLRNVLAINKGVYSDKRWMGLYQDKDSSAMHSIFENYGKKDAKQVKIEVDKLDNILRMCHVDRVQTIKIDVEGAEIEAIKGMEKTLNKNRPLSILLGSHTVEGKNLRRPCEKLLKGYGFGKILGTKFPEITIFGKSEWRPKLSKNL